MCFCLIITVWRRHGISQAWASSKRNILLVFRFLIILSISTLRLCTVSEAQFLSQCEFRYLYFSPASCGNIRFLPQFEKKYSFEMFLEQIVGMIKVFFDPHIFRKSMTVALTRRSTWFVQHIVFDRVMRWVMSSKSQFISLRILAFVFDIKAVERSNRSDNVEKFITIFNRPFPDCVFLIFVNLIGFDIWQMGWDGFLNYRSTLNLDGIEYLRWLIKIEWEFICWPTANPGRSPKPTIMKQNK